MKQLRDQTAHFGLAFLVVSLARWLGADIPPLAGALLGWAPGLVREVTEGGNVLSDGSILDMVFWMAGGVAATLPEYPG